MFLSSSMQGELAIAVDEWKSKTVRHRLRQTVIEKHLCVQPKLVKAIHIIHNAYKI